MSKLLYAVEYATEDSFGAFYVDRKVVLNAITEQGIQTEIANEREVNRIDELGFNPNDDPEQTGLSAVELSGIATQLATQEPNEWLAVLSRVQGKWLYANHPDFKPVEEVEQ